MSAVDSERITSSLSAYARSRLDIVALYLYGSRASDTARPDSDIDVAVLLASSVTDTTRAELELEREMGSLPGLGAAEVVVLNRVPLKLAAEVLTTGRRIYVRDEEARIEFEFDTMRQWWDEQPWREEYNREFIAAMKEHFTDEQRRAYQRARQAPAPAN
ncbi:MAG: nucleotidyltransferase domain-containing protein [Chloroflexi bacterium]|nr:nucleotidyltransferase domain-containing protein [Chloroflexota bacterium]